MPSRKQEKRRRKLRVHGPSTDAVGAPPTGRKAPRETAPATRSSRSRREPAVPSLKRSARKSGLLLALMVAVIVATSHGQSTKSLLGTLAVFVAVIPLFVVFDLWMARKVYKKVTGREAPR